MTEQEPTHKTWRQRLDELPVQAGLPGFPTPSPAVLLDIVTEALAEMDLHVDQKLRESFQRNRQRQQAAQDRGEPDNPAITI